MHGRVCLGCERGRIAYSVWWLHIGVYATLPTSVAEQRLDSMVLGRAILIGDVPAYARNRRARLAF